MPTYEYVCDACEHGFEEFQSFSDAPLTKCPKCGKKKLRRLFGTFGGWIMLPDALRAELLDEIERIADDEFGGTVRRPYQTLIFTSQRAA